MTFIFQVFVFIFLWLFETDVWIQVSDMCRFLLNWNGLLRWFFFRFIFSWSYRAFDTLAKALNPGESAACQNSDSVEGSVQLIGGETSMNIVEIEGPLLSDAHVAFRVLNTLYCWLFINILIWWYNIINDLITFSFGFLWRGIIQVSAFISDECTAFVHWLAVCLVKINSSQLFTWTVCFTVFYLKNSR